MLLIGGHRAHQQSWRAGLKNESGHGLVDLEEEAEMAPGMAQL